MTRLQVNTRVIARKLAVQITAAIEESGKRVILVTSPNEGDGKSSLMKLLAPELDRVAPHRFTVLTVADLTDVNPWHTPDDRILLIDGPAMLEGEGFLNIRKGWISAIDGSLIVVMKRKTKMEDLKGVVTWLDAAKIPPIGIVWNEFACPPLATRLRLLWRKLRRPEMPSILKRFLVRKESSR